MQRSRPERQRLRQRLRAADPSGTGRLDIEPFTTLAAELGIDLLVRPFHWLLLLPRPLAAAALLSDRLPLLTQRAPAAQQPAATDALRECLVGQSVDYEMFASLL
eukprot:COSAG04_NODE_12068_length_672_cov_1.595113_1_plen_104_part_01